MEDNYKQEVMLQVPRAVGLVKQVRFYDSIDSTNLQAKREAESGMLVVADCQTAGCGRRGRRWQSPEGKNVYFSLVLKPDISPNKASMLTLVMALAAVKGVWSQLRQEQENNGRMLCVCPQIKWPNDIVLNGKKICGILTEMTMKQRAIDAVVIGVGMNVIRQDFAPELAKIASDLESECGEALSRSTLIVNILKEFENYYSIFLAKQNLQSMCREYNSLLVNQNREVRVLDPQGEYCGIALGINDSGELCVELADGSVVYVYAGEVSVRGIYGYV